MSKSQIIVTSRYLKSGTKKAKTKRKNYTKYIATREGAEIREQKSLSRVVSREKQKQLLNELLNDFPEAKKYLEYEDYISNQTVENASELISAIIELNTDVIGNRQNFVGYMALRPGAEKRGQHGLFNGSDEPIVLNKVTEEVANHPGIVWSHVVSLRREDAVRLGYDTSDMWRELVKRHIADIAKAQKIPLANMKWYAAFHNTTHHPHIHLIIYSTNPKEGYLTKEGINKIRSVFANDIFHDDLQSIYQEQTLSRDEIKAVSENQISDIMQRIQQSEFDDPQLEILVKKLYEQLKNVKGKKVYGYLPKEVKQTVNEIFSQLAKDKNIAALYEKWCELEKLKYKTYTQQDKDIPPIYENKVFTPVRNMIIKSVADMLWDNSIDEPEILPEENGNSDDFEIIIDESTEHERFVPNDEKTDRSAESGEQKAKRNAAQEFISGENTPQDIDRGINMLTELADKGDISAVYILGKLYFKGEYVYQDNDKAEKYLKIAADNGNEFAMYSLAKLYLTDEKYDLAKAVELLDKACANTQIQPYAAYSLAKIILNDNEFHNAELAVKLLETAADKNMWASYLLGRIYFLGTDGIAPDREQGRACLLKSAEDGNEYAQHILDNADRNEDMMFSNSVLGMLVGLSRIIADDYNKEQRKLKLQVDSKLRRIINRKKHELGIKQDSGQSF